MKSWQYCAQFFGKYYTFFVVVVVNLLYFVGSMSLTWSSPVLVKLEKGEENPLGHPVTPAQSDIIGSMFFVGATLGPLFFIRSADTLGRKRTIILLTIPSVSAYLLFIFAFRVEMYYIGRFLVGFSCGGFSSVISAYLSEVVFSAKNRGPLLALNSPLLQMGFLLSNIVGSYCSILTLNCMILTLSIVITVLITFCCPESPYYAIGTKGRDATMDILRGLDAEDADKEVGLIEKDTEQKKKSLVEIINTKGNAKPFIMATSLLLLQQLSGINILMAFSQQIFLKSKEILPAEQCSIILNVIQLLSTLAITITSQKFTRKTLLTVSLFGSGLFDFILGLYFYFEDKLTEYCWIPLISLVLFVIIYDAGLDPLPFVYLGEIYPLHLKFVGPALSMSIYWASLFILSLAFSKFHVSYLFFSYALCCFSGVFFVRYKITETKDKTLREIQDALKG